MYSKIDEQFWKDEKIQELSVHGRYLMLYFLTCPHRNMLGCFMLPKAYVAEDVQLSPRQVSRGLNECIDLGLLEYDEKAKVIFIRNFLKYSRIENPNQAEGARKRLKNEPKSLLFLKVAEILRAQELDWVAMDNLIKELRAKGGVNESIPKNHEKKRLKTAQFKKDILEERTKENIAMEIDQKNQCLLEDSFNQYELPKLKEGHKLNRRRSKLSELTLEQKQQLQIFWDIYPRKIGMGKVEKAWQKLNPDKELMDKILEGLNRAIKEDSRFREERYIPHPANWLDGRDWLSMYAGKTKAVPGRDGEQNYTQQELDKLFIDHLAEAFE